MESLSPQVVSAAKLPILNPNEFDLWKMRIKQYFLMTDYSLWEVILNGDSPIPTKVIDGVVQPVAPTTAEQRLARKNELKARGTLLMALPDKHQLKFNIHKDANSSIEAIEKRFGGNKETKKRNKSDLEDQSLNDLFNSLWIYEAKIKSSSSTSPTTQNIAFMSSQNTNSTNESVSVVTSVSTASTKVHVSALPNVDTLSDAVIYSFFASQSNSPQLDNDNLKQIDADDLEEMNLKWQMAMLTMRAMRFLQRTRRNLGANGTTSIRFDMSKAYEEPTNYALMEFTSSRSSSSDNEVAPCSKTCAKAYATMESHYDKLTNDLRKSQFNVLSYKTGLESIEARIVVYQQNENVFKDDIKLLKLDVILRDNALVYLRKKFKKEEQERDELKLKLENFQTSSKNLSKLLASQIIDKTGLGYDNQVFNSTVFDCDGLITSKSDVSMPSSPVYDRYKSGEGYHAVPPPYTGTFMPFKPDLVFHDAPTVNETVPTVLNVEPSTTKPNKDLSQHVFPTTVLTRSRLVPLTAARPVITVVPHTKVQHQRLTKHGVTKEHSPSRRLIILRPSPIHSNFHQNVTTVKATQVNAVQGVKGNWVWKPKCPVLDRVSRHISASITLKQFYYIDALGRSKVPRENNMYNADLKNIVPLGNLTCLFAKATLDESNLWHRRLGHINFKTMNKLVKGNLVRGLPSKVLKIIIHVLLVRRASNIEPFAEAVNTACYVQNRISVTKPHNKTPYELLLGRIPSIGFMRPFGCPMTILNTLDPLGKFNGKADEGFLVGYSVSSKAFKVFNGRTKIVQETLHINFLENQPNVIGSGPTWLFDIDSLTQSMNYQQVVAGNQPNPSEGIQEHFDADKPGEGNVQQYILFPLWSTSSKDPQNTDADTTFEVKEPESAVYVSLSRCDKTQKLDEKTNRETKGKCPVELSTGVRNLSEEFEDFSSSSTNEVNAASTPVTAVELNSTNNTNTFSVADMPALEDITYSDDEEDVGAEADFSILETNITVSPIPTTRVHKDHHVTQIIGDLFLAPPTRSMARMVNEQGRLTQINDNNFHTCMFACFLFQEEPKRGHTQEEGIDYEEVFAPVARIEAIRLFLAYASFMGFMVYQMDVKSAFLYGTIEEEVYFCQPIGFEDPNYPDKVYKVVKALYGLHQAPRAWYETLANYLLENGFQRGKIDQTLFIKKQKGDILLFQVYVDDIIFGSTNKDLKFGLTNGKSDSTPIDTEKPLLKDSDGEDVDVHTYRSMIGSLMYLTSSRPDIMFAVCACAHFQVTLKVSHLYTVKRIFRYLKGKPHLGLWYPKDSPFNLVVYSDSDYVGASLDRKSTTGGCQFLGCRLISWQCKKQTVVATSSLRLNM
nr:hypothetical protein [Tanacetum cinerariifolium]